MWTHIDAWIGKTLFHPPIIWLCQRLKLTQYRFSVYTWLIALFFWLTHNPKSWSDWFLYVFLVLLTIVQMLITLFCPEHILECTRGDGKYFRLFWIPYSVLFIVIPDAVTHTVQLWQPAALLVLMASYANTIDTIPPLEAKEPKRASKRPTPARQST